MEPKSGGRRPATYADLQALPEHLVGEIIDNELLVFPRPSPRHTLASSVLGAELGGRFGRDRGGPGGWWNLDEPELHLGRQVVVPDLAGWRRERMPRLPETAFFELPPDWVCEVQSPATAIIDRTKKLRIYENNRVPWLWFVDPVLRTLDVFHLGGQGWLMAGAFGGDQKVRVPPFEAMELELSALWEGSAPPSP